MRYRVVIIVLCLTLLGCQTWSGTYYEPIRSSYNWQADFQQMKEIGASEAIMRQANNPD